MLQQKIAVELALRGLFCPDAQYLAWPRKSGQLHISRQLILQTAEEAKGIVALYSIIKRFSSIKTAA